MSDSFLYKWKSVHECTNCGMWTVHSNLSLWSSISTISCFQVLHPHKGSSEEQRFLLASQQEMKKGHITPPVSSCANARCLCSDAIQMFQDLNHLKTKGLQEARVHDDIIVINSKYVGGILFLNLFRTSTPSKYLQAVPGMARSAHMARACDTLISTPTPASESSFCTLQKQYC